MKSNPYDVLKSKLADYREKTKRGREIDREEIKAGKVPIPFIFLGFALILAIVISFLFLYLVKSSENIQILIILSIQTVVIAIQLWVMYAQTRNEKMSNLPEFIIETDNYSKGMNHPLLTAIYIKNIGQTAHKVSFNIKATKKGDALNTNDNKFHHLLYTFRNEERKLACELIKNEYVNKRIRVDLEYRDKMGKYCSAKFLKLEGENEFERMFTGLE